jgi:hypothetical protein
MKIGDVILEVNSIPVKTPQQLQTEVAKARDKLQLKVVTPVEEKAPLTSGQVGRGTTSKDLGTSSHEGQKTLVSLKVGRASTRFLKI